MSSDKYPRRNIGIYRNLPDFDPSIKGLTAIITGANGISGFGTLRALLDAPERWVKIFTVSRSPPAKSMMDLLTSEQQARVQHVACDLLKSPDEIADTLKAAGVTADHVFFYSYLQPKPPPGGAIWSNADELVKVNSALVSNFLNALPKAGISPQRFLLQTGAKNYGVHLGRTRTPCVESDPQPRHLQPNFYYPQEDLVTEYCKANPNTRYNFIRPAWIIAAVTNAAMNAIYPYGVYAAVQAHKKEPIAFAGDFDAWLAEAHHSTARLTGYLSEWAVLEPKCADQAFNAQDDSPLSWDRFFEELSRWYNVSAGIKGPLEDESKFASMSGPEGSSAPIGYGPPGVMKSSFALTEWAKDSANAQAWQAMMKESGGKLTYNPFDDVEANFAFGDAARMQFGSMCMNKAKRFGWTGFVDTIEGIFEMFDEMVPLGMLPPMAVKTANPLV